MKIQIKKSKNADTRTCDWSKVTKDDLRKNSLQHIYDVMKGMLFFSKLIRDAGFKHDYTKIDQIDQFHKDFSHGFDKDHQTWWKNHQEEERHHLKDPDYVQNNVNLIDILEMITDGVMAGLARSGEYRPEEISDDLLRKAFDNTIQLLLDNVELEQSAGDK